MDLDNSRHSSTQSSDTDILIKIPNNFFDPNINLEKSHFSNDNDFMRELDNFLHIEQRDDAHNSTSKDPLSYHSFSDLLQQPVIDKTDHDLNMQEERLKRDHYEQLSSILQKKILQYQQKTAILTKLDFEKDQLIRKLRMNEGLDEENKRLKIKVANLEQEISATVQLINKFQAKNEMLELKIENLTSNSTEMREISKKQILDLEVRMSNSLKIEKDLQHKIDDLKSNCKAERENFIKEKHTRSRLEREVCNLNSQLRQTKEDHLKLHERHDKEKQNTEMKQKKIFSNMMDDFTDKERKLLKELDMQRVGLKNYYQAQLETALEEKVEEFQEQLEKFYDEIKVEADKRERILNNRAITQMEMIVRKNEEEIDLINRKCTEEVELYKIQLLNATRTIENLESKLGEYQIRRHDIAENLHSIMETQWKKTLEILTNPSRSTHEHFFESNVVSESDNNQQLQHQNLNSELLRNYIEALLKQSPKSDQVNDELNSVRFSGRSTHRAVSTSLGNNIKLHNNQYF